MDKVMDAVWVARDFLVFSPVRSFALIAGIFGTLLILVVPPFAGADEEAHFVRAYGLAKGKVIIYHGEKIDMPVSYQKTLGCLQSKREILGEPYTYRYNQYGQAKLATLGCISRIQHNPTTTLPVRTTAANYSPIAYIPQVIAIGVGNLFRAPPVMLDYLMRFSVLIAYIGLIVLAIKLIPVRKWALVGVALLPHAVMQVTNPGADYMLLGATAVFMAAIIRSRVLTKSRFSKENKVLFTITILAAVSMIFTKGIFPGICFLPLLLFYGGFKRYLLLKLTAAILVFIVGVVWQKTALLSGAAISGVSNSIIEFPYAFIKTMFYGWFDSDFIYMRSGMGLDNYVGMPSVIITIINILFALYIFVGYPSDNFKQRVKVFEHRSMLILMLLAATATIIGSFAALYITVTDLRGENGVINGVQARYFYPAFIVLAIMPFVRKVQTSISHYAFVVVTGSVLVLFSQVLTVAVRHGWL